MGEPKAEGDLTAGNSCGAGGPGSAGGSAGDRAGGSPTILKRSTISPTLVWPQGHRSDQCELDFVRKRDLLVAATWRSGS